MDPLTVSTIIFSSSIAAILCIIALIKNKIKLILPALVVFMLLLLTYFFILESNYLETTLLDLVKNEKLEPIIVIGGSYDGARNLIGKTMITYEENPEVYHRSVEMIIGASTFVVAILSYLPLLLGILMLNLKKNDFWPEFFYRFFIILFSSTLWLYGIGNNLSIIQANVPRGSLGYWIQSIIMMSIFFAFPIATSKAWKKANSMEDNISLFEKVLTKLATFSLGAVVICDIVFVLLSFVVLPFNLSSMHPLFLLLGGIMFIYFAKLDAIVSLLFKAKDIIAGYFFN